MMKPTATQIDEDFDSGDAFGVPKLQRNTLNEEVYEELKHALMSGRIAPGTTITIRGLANSFGISPMPVREALRRLVAEHVLVLLPNRSVSLPVFTRERFRETTQIRIALEGLAAEQATALISENDVKEMSRLNTLMENGLKSASADILAWNREFHFTLYRSARMTTLVKIVETLWLQIGPLLTIQQNRLARSKIRMYERHHQVLKGLEKRDAAQVRRAIVGDIEDAAKFIAKHL